MKIRAQFSINTYLMNRLLVPIGVSMLFTAGPAYAYNNPSPPRTFDTSYSAPTGATITVGAGGDFQSALDDAKPGDSIVLQAGATYKGPFTLPNKTSGIGWIYIRSSSYSSLPAPGTRVSIGDSANMPKIVATTSGVSAIQTTSGTHHYRFVGIEFRPVAGNFMYNLIALGDGDSSVATLPNNITFDRCYIHGDPSAGTRRGIAGNAAYVAVVDSYLSDFKEVGADSQAFWAANTPGPIKIVNNYLEAAGENIMFGGAQPTIVAFIPADIEVRNNLITKPLSWIGSPWSVKNLIEFKLGIRAIVSNNQFVNNWAAAQSGFAMLITPRNEKNSFPQAVVKDIAVKENVFTNVGQGIDVAGIDNGDGVAGRTSQRTTRVLIKDNVINVSMLAATGLSDGRVFLITGGPEDLTIDHNTALLPNAGNSSASVTDNLYANNTTPNIPANRFTFTNNIVSNGTYSWWGTNTNTAITTMARHFTNSIFTNNAIIDIAYGNYKPDQFPSGNYFPVSIAAVKFSDPARSDFRLASASQFKGAGLDGLDLGANVNPIVQAAPTAKKPVAPKNISVQ